MYIYHACIALWTVAATRRSILCLCVFVHFFTCQHAITYNNNNITAFAPLEGHSIKTP